MLAAVGLVVGVVRVVVPPAAPIALPVPPPMTSALTRHLAFVIVDGLRFDTATNAELMPHFSRRMSAKPSGEMWAGEVSMTSSAILTYGTGQRGSADQIINNETGSAVAYNNLLDNAQAAGLFTAGTGDRAWFRMFRGWSWKHPDPEGVAIDVDYNAEIFEAARTALTKQPNLLVVHFVTPDHQAHAYGSLSERYRRHIHDFDGKLEAFLEELPADMTVVITSDHGATDTGTHGSDTPVQRRSPFIAYGPGLVKGPLANRVLDQIDVPSTFAALLGIAAPAHGRGNVLVELLDVSEAERARIACADLTRLAAYARATVSDADAIVKGACAAPTVEGARTAARTIDAALGSAGLGGAAFAWLVPVLALFAAFILGALALRRPTPRVLALGAAMLTVAVALTKVVERTSWHWPTVFRVLLYIAGNALVLAGLRRLEKTAAWIDQRATFAILAIPGLLLVTPSRTTQIEAFVLLAVVGLLILSGRMPLPARAPRRTWIVGVVLLVAIAPISLKENIMIPKWIMGHPRPWAFLALASLGVERAARVGTSRARMLAALGVAVAMASLVVREIAPPRVCLTAWLGLPLLAIALWRFRPLGELLLVAAYGMVSRDFDLPILVLILLFASAVGNALGPQLGSASGRPFVAVALVTFLFSLGVLTRIGIENGLDFTQLDWGAAAFRDPNASIVRIGAALVWKHAFTRAAGIYLLFAALPPPLRMMTARGLVAAEAFRAAVLVVVLYACGDSFWTALRVIGDLPHAFIGMVVAAAALVVCARSEGGSLARLAPVRATLGDRGGEPG